MQKASSAGWMRRSQLALRWLGLVALAVACEGEPLASGGDGPTTSIACVDCHLVDYEKTSNPPHKINKYATTCTDCHTTESWHGGENFKHPVSFPLTGKHATVPCSGCHATEPSPSSECVGCHKDDWEFSIAPPHKQAGIPQQCSDCHTDAGWQGAKFTKHEDVFPLATSDKHNGIACTTCHNDPTEYLTVNCLAACHTKDETDKEHDEEFGYEYNTPACLSCHPKGSADD